MKNLFSFALAIALSSFEVLSHAGVPQLISYQGRVTVTNNSFTGTGQFKFALVGADGAPSFWSNDGTSTDGSEPKYSVPINVLNGLFSILLGDDMLPNMVPILPTVFTNSHVALRIWFSDGTNAFARLAPDQRISAVGYAMIAESVPDGSITSTKLADGAVTAAKLTDASITSAKLAPGAVSSNLMSSGQSGVGSGGIVFSLDANSASLMSIGFKNIGSMPWNQEHWQTRANGPGGRVGHTTVWTSTELLAWGGGRAGSFLNDGGRYNPATDTWQPIPTSGAPAGRWYHQAVWTGTEMLIWGGRAAFFQTEANKNDGGRYNPISNTWSPITTNGAPISRSWFVAVWTGTEMLVWGGITDGGVSLTTGGRYNPSSDIWLPITTNGAPVGRMYCVAEWTGTEMIVWGGSQASGTDFTGTRNDGGRYNPATDQWTPLPTEGAPPPAAAGQAVWTGTEMIVWGGSDVDRVTANGTAVTLASGGRYSPESNSWRSLTAAGVPASRRHYSAIWTGSEMVVFGGVNSELTSQSQVFLNSGGRYNPSTDAWTSLSLTDTPSARAYPGAVWTGQGILIYAGYNNQDGSNELNTTHSWVPSNALYLYQRP